MVDRLAHSIDLCDFLGDSGTLSDAQALLLLELATGEVQAASGQRLVEVTDDQVDVMGTTDSWLALPQRPVNDVTSVEIDGEAVTDWRRHGARLWRACGWSSHVHQPSTVTVTYDHGYSVDDPALAFARKQVLGLAAFLHSNPTGATGFSIDDYREQYSQAADGTGSVLPKAAQQALRHRYGVRAGLARIG